MVRRAEVLVATVQLVSDVVQRDAFVTVALQEANVCDKAVILNIMYCANLHQTKKFLDCTHVHRTHTCIVKLWK